MKRRRALPPIAQRTVFLVADALAAGASREQLRRDDLWSPTNGVLQYRDRPVDPQDVYRAYSRLTPQGCLSHTSAAHAWGIWLDRRFPPSYPVHVTRADDGRNPRRRNVVGHRALMGEQDLCEIEGIRLTTPARTWADLAGMGMTVQELVIAGDALLQRPDGPPRQPGLLGRNPLATLDELHATLGRRDVPGLPLARKAVLLVRPGVDSAPESFLRQLIVAAGYPEPWVNVPVVLPGGRTILPDLQFRELRIAIQYEGGHHAGTDQIGKDIGRDFAFASSGWLTVKADRAILHPEGRARFLARLAHAFATRGVMLPTVA